MTVGPLGKREVRAILYEGANKYDPAFDEEYVEAVAERSEGNPLYLTLLAEELFQGKLEVGDIDALPQKIGELYGEALRRVTDEGENQTVLYLLHLLAEAKAPLTTVAIAEILDINPMQASSGARDAMELLHEANPEALYPTEDVPEEAVQLFHESLREWLREEHTAACEEMQEKLAEKTADWGERRNETARRYALRYGAAHQREAGRQEELYDLLTGESYQEEQVSTFKQYEATFASFEAGLESYVERDGGTPTDDARLCRLALDAGQAAREAKEGVTQAFRWAEDGRMDDALQRIEVLGEEKYFLAALRLMWIEADRQAEWPEEERSADEAQRVIDAVEERIPPGTEAIDWSEFIDKDFMAWWASRVLRALPDVDVTAPLLRTSELDTFSEALVNYIDSKTENRDLRALCQSALQVIQSIEDDLSRSDAFAEMARALASTGNDPEAHEALERALDTADLIEDDYNGRGRALRNMVSLLADTGAFERAFEVLNLIDDRSDRTEALAEAASAFAEAGRLKHLLDTILSIDDDSDRDGALRNLTSVLADSGNFDPAVDVAQRIDQTGDRDKAFTDVASALASCNNFEWALDIAQKIGSDHNRARTLADLAQGLANAGYIQRAQSATDQALEVAESINSDFLSNRVLPEVASEIARSGSRERAFDTVRSIKDDSHRDRAIRNVASALVKSGAFEVETDLLEQTFDFVRSMDGEPDQAKGFIALVRGFSNAGDTWRAQTAFDQAVHIVKSIEVDAYRNKALCHLASVLADMVSTLVFNDAATTENGVFDRAINIVQAIQQKGFDRSDALTDLASSFAYAGAFEQAFVIAQSIDDSTFYRVEALEAVIAEAVETEAFDQAIRIAQSVDWKQRRIKTQTKIVCVLADTGNEQQACEIFERTLTNRSLDLSGDRDSALQNLACILAESGTFDRALNAAQLIEKNSDRARTLTELARNFADAEETQRMQTAFGRALNAARSIDSERTRANVFTDLASSLAEHNEKDRAHEAFGQTLAAARSIDANSVCSLVLERLASALAEVNASEQVLDIDRISESVNESIDSNSDRAETLTDLAHAFADAGNSQQAHIVCRRALSTTESVNRFLRGSIHRSIASVFVKTENFERALDLASSINQDRERAWALTALAQGLTEIKNNSQTKVTVDRVLDAARPIDKPHVRAEAFTGIAQALSDAGKHEKASAVFDQTLDTVQLIDDSRRNNALCELVSALANFGNFEQAFDIAQSIDQDRTRAEALTELGQSLTEFRDNPQTRITYNRILNAARSIDKLHARAEAFTGIAQALSDAGKHEKASTVWDQTLDATQLVDDGSDQDEILCEVAFALANSDELERALEVAHSIGDDIERDRAFSKVAQISVHTGHLDFGIDTCLSIADLSERASTVISVAKQQANSGWAEAFAERLPAIELSHDGWSDFLPTWRQALLEHEEDPRFLLRRSLTLDPFDAEAAAEGVHSLVQAHIQAGAMNHAEAIARECPELELDVLVSESGPPIPEGCDPDDLPVRQRAEYDTYVELYEEGTLDDAAFESKVEELFDEADLA